jgi:hypothetical protein
MSRLLFLFCFLMIGCLSLAHGQDAKAVQRQTADIIMLDTM